jgi:Spy/CpxP family protein refolding chaperone
MKSVLTEEQRKKLKESGHKRMEGRKEKMEPNKTI